MFAPRVDIQKVFDGNSFLMRLLPPVNEVSGKVMFLHLRVILFTGGGGSPCRQTWGLGWADPINKRAVHILLEYLFSLGRGHPDEIKENLRGVGESGRLPLDP